MSEDPRNAIIEIKKILDDNPSLPRIVCESCGFIMVPDPEAIVGKHLSDRSWGSVSKELMGNMKERHRTLHILPASREEREILFESAEDGKAFRRVLNMIGLLWKGGYGA